MAVESSRPRRVFEAEPHRLGALPEAFLIASITIRRCSRRSQHRIVVCAADSILSERQHNGNAARICAPPGRASLRPTADVHDDYGATKRAVALPGNSDFPDARRARGEGSDKEAPRPHGASPD